MFDTPEKYTSILGKVNNTFFTIKPDIKELRWQAALSALPSVMSVLWDKTNYEVIARSAFEIADALLKEGGYVE